MPRSLCFLISSLLLLAALTARAQTVGTITADQLQNGKAVELDKLGWKYTPDDDPRFAEPQFDDRAWETLNGTAITLDSIPKSGWRGIGWFRLRLQVDPTLANQPLALIIAHFGASEIYLDGKLLQRFGTVGATLETEVGYNPSIRPVILVLTEQREHVLALRHSCQAMRNLESGWGRWFAKQGGRPGLNNSTGGATGKGAGFVISIAEVKQALAVLESLRSFIGGGLLRVGIFLAIGLLHLLLYWFYPYERANLFFGLFLLSAAGLSFYLVQVVLSHQDIGYVIAYYAAAVWTLIAIPALLLGFTYAAFSLRPSRQYWWWLVVSALLIPIDLLFPGKARALLPVMGLYPLIEIVFVSNRLIKMKIENAKVISPAILIFLLVHNFGILASTRLIPGAAFIPTAMNVAAITLTIAFSAFLARRFAHTSLNLQAQLVQVKQLSAAALEHEKVKAENERRAKELEEARQLQLSMLPKKLPNLPHLDIAAYMKTASEVGGDYYDFHLGEDGTLTIAVGDATGHGLKAGTLVTATKSLFDTLAYHPDIPHIFDRLSRTLKRMNPRGLFMAMTMVKVQGHQLSVSIAGMPPVLIYRALTGAVEEIAIQALPLGGITGYQYKQAECALNTGDVVVLLSDGLPERFNPQDEMFDYAATKRALAEAASQSPQQLIEHLVQAGETWAQGRAQDDDVTFVVLKVKANGAENG